MWLAPKKFILHRVQVCCGEGGGALGCCQTSPPPLQCEVCCARVSRVLSFTRRRLPSVASHLLIFLLPLLFRQGRLSSHSTKVNLANSVRKCKPTLAPSSSFPAYRRTSSSDRLAPLAPFLYLSFLASQPDLPLPPGFNSIADSQSHLFLTSLHTWIRTKRARM